MKLPTIKQSKKTQKNYPSKFLPKTNNTLSNPLLQRTSQDLLILNSAKLWVLLGWAEYSLLRANPSCWLLLLLQAALVL